MLRYLSLALLLAAIAACDGRAPKLNTGDVAPAFTTTYMDGKPMRFPDDVRGKTVMIRFWADWCTTCESELKDLEKIYQRRRGQGLVVLAVNEGQDAVRVSSFMGKLGVSYPSLLDLKMSIARQYGVDGVPTTIYVNASGIVRGKVVGSADAAVFDKLAEEVMEGKR
jgi:peroxiredoxin